MCAPTCPQEWRSKRWTACWSFSPWWTDQRWWWERLWNNWPPRHPPGPESTAKPRNTEKQDYLTIANHIHILKTTTQTCKRGIWVKWCLNKKVIRFWVNLIRKALRGVCRTYILVDEGAGQCHYRPEENTHTHDRLPVVPVAEVTEQRSQKHVTADENWRGRKSQGKYEKKN